MRVASIRYPTFYFAQHAVLIFLYTTLKNMISIVGLYDHLHGHNHWVVTPRGKQAVPMLPTGKGPILAPVQRG